MTQRIIITILFLVTVSLGSNNARAGKLAAAKVNNSYTTQLELTDVKDIPVPVKPQPIMPSSAPDSPHGKALKAPQLEELPHIHRYHRERVKKNVAHQGKFWFLGQVLVVLSQLSLLFIAYMHITH